jgi:hypothetical protein
MLWNVIVIVDYIEHQAAVIAEEVLLRGCQVVGLPVLRSVLRPHSLSKKLI